MNVKRKHYLLLLTINVAKFHVAFRTIIIYTKALQWVGKKRAWYPLFVHVLNFLKLLCYIRTTATT